MPSDEFWGWGSQLNSAKWEQMHLVYVIFKNNEEHTDPFCHSAGFRIKLRELINIQIQTGTNAARSGRAWSFYECISRTEFSASIYPLKKPF